VQPLVGRHQRGNRVIEIGGRCDAVRFRHGSENGSSPL
jgi:hypothetical protein